MDQCRGRRSGHEWIGREGRPRRGTPATIAKSQPYARGIAIDSNSVYWNANNIIKAPLGGGTGTTLASGTWTGLVALYNNDVYWSDSQTGGIMKVSINGGTVTTLYSDSMGNTIFSMAVDANGVFYTPVMAPGLLTNNGVIRIAPP